MSIPRRNLQSAAPRWWQPIDQQWDNLRYIGIHGGRGSSKSHSVAEFGVVERAATEKLDIVCLREVQKSLKLSAKRLIEAKIENMGLGKLFDIQETKITSRTGSLIIFEGMQNHTADSIKSLEGFDVAWVEEAQSLSQRSLDILRPTIRKPRSKLIFSWNPDEPTDPVDSLLRGQVLPPDALVVEVNYRDNPWFPKVLRDEMEYDLRRDPDKYAHIWLGGYLKNSEARVFRNWTVEEFTTPPDANHRLGADWGFAVDPTCAVRCHLVGRKLYVDYEAYQVGCEIVDTPSLLMTIPEAERWPMTADSARPETISHVRQNGFPKIFPAIKGPGSIEDGVEWLKSCDIIVHPRCKHVIDEMTLYSYKVDPKDDKVLPVLADKHNHVIDALRYANEGARRAARVQAPPKFEAVPVMHHWR